MKLQLWTTVDGEADELLGELDVNDQEWWAGQTDPGSALALLGNLADEIVG